MNETAVITTIVGLLIGLLGVIAALFFVFTEQAMARRRYDFTQQQIRDWVGIMGMIVKELSKLNHNDDKLLKSLKKYETDEQQRH